jgi:hypothetical protein
VLHPETLVIQHLGANPRCLPKLAATLSLFIRRSEWFNAQIKEMDVQNSYFPMFISAKVLEREKDHIEGFSPEVAWVTRA